MFKQNTSIKHLSTLFLKVIIIFIGVLTLTGMIWEPQVEGRNVNADFVTIYFRDPFLAYVYISSIPFFVILYQAFKLSTYIDKNKIFTKVSVKALQTIKYCALSLVAAIFGAEMYFFLVQRGKDDIAGGVMIGLLMILFSLAIAVTAAVSEKLLQNAVDVKVRR